jgi:MATE family multidrug resistance protein
MSAAAWGRALVDLPSLLRFGLMPAIAAGLELGGFSLLIALSTQLGPVTAGAFQTVFSLHNLMFAMAIGFASAAGVRVGNAVGAGEAHLAGARIRVAIMLAAVCMGLGGALMAMAPHLAVAPFSSDAALLAQSAVMLALLGPFMAFDGIQLVCVYALRSLGDQVVAGINSILGYFLLTGALGWWLVRHGHGGTGLIIAMIAGMVVTALLQTARVGWISFRSARRS